MSRMKSLLALAMVSAMADQSEYEHGSKPVTYRPSSTDPEWKRKKCKSCKSFHAGCGSCGYPNNQACKNYSKRKK